MAQKLWQMPSLHHEKLRETGKRIANLEPELLICNFRLIDIKKTSKREMKKRKNHW